MYLAISKRSEYPSGWLAMSCLRDGTQIGGKVEIVVKLMVKLRWFREKHPKGALLWGPLST